MKRDLEKQLHQTMFFSLKLFFEDYKFFLSFSLLLLAISLDTFHQKKHFSATKLFVNNVACKHKQFLNALEQNIRNFSVFWDLIFSCPNKMRVGMRIAKVFFSRNL